MADCFFIGIGGSGSKCVNNYTYACASGLGPENLWLGMVDQDDANGNVAESRSNIQNYQRVRKILRTPGVSDINNSTNVFKTNSGTTLNSNAVSNFYANAGIKPEIHKELELGIEGKFLKNRVGIDISAYTKDSEDLIIDLELDQSTGYSSSTVNSA